MADDAKTERLYEAKAPLWAKDGSGGVLRRGDRFRAAQDDPRVLSGKAELVKESGPSKAQAEALDKAANATTATPPSASSSKPAGGDRPKP